MSCFGVEPIWMIDSCGTVLIVVSFIDGIYLSLIKNRKEISRMMLSRRLLWGMQDEGENLSLV